MKKVFLIAFCALLVSCTGANTPYSHEDSVRSAKRVDSMMKLDTGYNAKTVSANPDNWSYHEEANKMDDSKIYFADATSTSQLSLSAPYDGENNAHIEVRKKEGVNNVIFTVDKGQFITDVYGTTIRVRFDKNKAEVYSCNRSADDNPAVLFIESANRFISKLKKSDSLIIEATMYQDGKQQMEFNTKGFKWNY